MRHAVGAGCEPAVKVEHVGLNPGCIALVRPACSLVGGAQASPEEPQPGPQDESSGRKETCEVPQSSEFCKVPQSRPTCVTSQSVGKSQGAVNAVGASGCEREYVVGEACVDVGRLVGQRGDDEKRNSDPLPELPCTHVACKDLEHDGQMVGRFVEVGKRRVEMKVFKLGDETICFKFGRSLKKLRKVEFLACHLKMRTWSPFTRSQQAIHPESQLKAST